VGHTQRASIDVERNELYVMTGLHKDKEKPNQSAGGQAGAGAAAPPPPGGNSRWSSEGAVSNVFWVYAIDSNRWTCLYRSDDQQGASSRRAQPPPTYAKEPRPRYAHQLVYDDINKVHYVFGGNPGGKDGKDAKVRLGDFWSLKLERPTRKEVREKSIPLKWRQLFPLCVCVDDPPLPKADERSALRGNGGGREDGRRQDGRPALPANERGHAGRSR